ncbi:hypothetical protein C8F04DRAFT_1254950 [Mycena alexandri]|uniref:F-box domain-containing protein n=1 Tax=Mycena alexandri TaxID=1745969 RepID=A0AAD6T8D7_9AGAR|nr:hypothetical protein C8F04DRAFT_1254950 [Mycena alexandri]
MTLTSLGEYLIILVCLELPLVDITSLRQVCRCLTEATNAKVLWIKILDQRIRNAGTVLPPYLKGHEALDVIALEALARRLSRLADKWEAGNLSPVKNWRLRLAQSITWLRLVNGNWLFVASSDTSVSKISCWDLSLVFQGSIEPVAEAYLPGQVKTAKLEVQSSGVVLALGLGPESPSIHVITLRQHSGRHVFSQLCCVEDSSHVLLICGDVLGCAVRQGAVVPHLVNWKTGEIHNIPHPPTGGDIPGRRNVPHLMTVWGEFLVVLRKDTLEFYTLPSPVSDSIFFVKLIKTPAIWEAAVCGSAHMHAANTTPLRIITLTPDGITLCVIEHHDFAGFNDDTICPNFCLARCPQRLYLSEDDEEPWYRLSIGENGQRALWIATDEDVDECYNNPAHFVYASVPLPPPEAPMPRITWNDDADEPALWALPCVDFDEALGLTVVGNCFGELAIYDHDGRHPERCRNLATDFTDQPTSKEGLLPTVPLKLDLPVAPRREMTDFELNNSVISQWSKDHLDFPEDWSRAWLGYQGYWQWDLWHGIPCDFAWLLEHAYGFPGAVIPQAYKYISEISEQHLLFRVGNRYLLFIWADTQFRSWPLSETAGFGFDVFESEIEPYICRTAVTERRRYRTMLASEQVWKGKHRWAEMAGRGGCPDERLLVQE